MNELKPCPFCGGYVVKQSSTVLCGHGHYEDEKYVYCTRCGMSWYPPSTVMKNHEIIAAWNRRENE